MVDETTDAKEPITVALLVEHKSKMPTQLFLRLQLSEYINSIMKMNYNKATDTTIPVLSIIFNQFDKGWEAGTFRGLFPKVSYKFARFFFQKNTRAPIDFFSARLFFRRKKTVRGESCRAYSAPE